jgi:hypothetical protein
MAAMADSDEEGESCLDDNDSVAYHYNFGSGDISFWESCTTLS